MDKLSTIITNSASRSLIEDYQKFFVEFLSRYTGNHKQMQLLEDILQAYPVLLNGVHYWRSISDYGIDFDFPDLHGSHFSNVIAWSKILNGQEITCAINLNQQTYVSNYVTIDNKLNSSGSKLKCLYTSDNSPAELNVEDRNGKSVRMTIPAGGLVIYGRI